MTWNPFIGDDIVNNSMNFSTTSFRGNFIKLRKNNKKMKRREIQKIADYDSSLSELDSEEKDKIYKHVVIQICVTSFFYYSICSLLFI